MGLLLGSSGCAFASLASEDYVTLDGNRNYGIFEGRNGGTGCLGQCETVKMDNEMKCEKDESACLLFKLFPIMSGVCGIVAMCLLTFTSTSKILKFNKEIAAWVIMWVGLCSSVTSLLVQTLVPVIDNKSLWDLHSNPKYHVKWGEGFRLVCFSIGLMALAVILHGTGNVEIFSRTNII